MGKSTTGTWKEYVHNLKESLGHLEGRMSVMDKAVATQNAMLSVLGSIVDRVESSGQTGDARLYWLRVVEILYTCLTNIETLSMEIEKLDRANLTLSQLNETLGDRIKELEKQLDTALNIEIL